METTDKTFLEMQQQMQQLREILENEKIVNERLLQKSCRQTAKRLKFMANLPIVFAAVAILCSPSFFMLGTSIWFVLFTCLLMLVCIVATILTNRHIPQMDTDLVNATQELTRFKKIHAEWLKFAIPMLILWFGWLLLEIFRNMDIDPLEGYAFTAGVVIGLFLGGIIGMKNRRDQLNAADELLAQLKELKETD